MPRLPYSSLDGQAQPGIIQAPDAYNRVPVDPAAFGVNDGQAVQNLGRALQGAGGTALDIATEQQITINQGRIADALNTAQQSSQKVQSGDPDDSSKPGFYALKGSQAVGAYKDATQRVQDAYKQARSGLDNEVQRNQFDRMSRRTLNEELATMGKHYAQQTQAYAMDAQQSLVQTSMQGGINAWTNDTLFHQQLEAAQAHQHGLDVMKGLPPETQQQNAADIASKMHAERVQRMAPDDPLAAMSYLQSHLDQINGTTQTALLQHLKPQVDKAGAQADADTVTGRYGGTAAMRLAALTGPVPDMIKASATRQGIDVGDALTVAKIESGVGTAADRPGSQFRGVYQMGDAAWAARGGTAANRGDLSAQVDLGIANLAHSKEVASGAVGRPAAGWEAYLVHQQGDGGGGALLRADAERNAVDVLTPAYKGNAAAARAAVVQNGGTADMTAGQFRGLWRAKFQAAGGNSGPSKDDAPQLRSLDDMLGQLEPMIQGRSPEWQDRARSLVTQSWNQQQARTHGQRTDILKRAGDVNAALADGHDVQPIDESAIRTAFAGQPEQADRLIRTQQDAQASGQLMQGMAYV